jgi:hypothetical protein
VGLRVVRLVHDDDIRVTTVPLLIRLTRLVAP